MDNITQTILNEILERLKRIENKIEKPIEQERKPIWKTNPNKPATEKQIYAIHSAGGEVWEGMTQGDIEEAFKKIKRQDNRVNYQVEHTQTQNPLTEEEIKQIEESGY